MLGIAVTPVEREGATETFFCQSLVSQLGINQAAHVIGNRIGWIGRYGALDFIKRNFELATLQVASSQLQADDRASPRISHIRGRHDVAG